MLRGTARFFGHADCRHNVSHPSLIEGLERRVLLFSVPVHFDLTSDALPFLNTETTAAINAGHAIVDTAGAFEDENHFDNSQFVAGVENINAQYADVIADANPADLDPLLAAGNFGHVLHGAEDLYAHSNWVNLGQTTLFDDGAGLWTPVTPYEVRDGAMIVQGPSPFGPGSVSRDGFVVYVNDGTQTYEGVITGQFGTAPADVPPEAVVTHEELNKDSADRPLFAEAYALAREQARHEFYRVVQLVEAQYGTAEPLLDAWVGDDPVARQQVQDLLVEQTLSLGAVDGAGVLTLNAGSRAALRGPYVDDTDAAEAFTVTHVSGDAGAEVVDVSWNGLTQRFTGVSGVVVDAGAGDDALTTTGVVSPVRFVGGDGSDALTVQAASGTTAASYVVAADRVVAGAATEFSGIERLVVNAADGADTINVQATAPGVAVEVNAGGGGDRITVDSNGSAAGGTVDGVRSPLTLNGGAGRNTLTLEDGSDATADVITVTPTAVGTAAGDTFFAPGGRLAYTGIAVLTLNAPSASAGDTVRVTPSASTSFTINGNGPRGGQGDLLVVDTAGTSGRKRKVTGKDAGVWTFSNRLAVNYLQFEQVKEQK